MFFNKCLAINEYGHLTIGGCDSIDLIERFSTPLYVMDEQEIRNNCRLYKDSFKKYYDNYGMPLYASKALNCLEICRIVNSEGLGLDVVSAGELYTALKAGFPSNRIHFHGNNKTYDEIKMAVENNVYRIVVDNFEEMATINSIACSLGKSIGISIRIKPGIDAHTHKFIKTGQIDSKFGFALETGEAIEAVKMADQFDHVSLKGLHCHIGSQIFDIDPFIHAAEVMIDFIKKIKDICKIDIEELNLGGGFGIKYKPKDKPVDYDMYIRSVSNVIKQKVKEYNIKAPYIYIEPGRSIVGEAGITLYKVGSIKKIPGVRNYVSVDGGMCDNPRYALYQAEYTCLLANKANEAPNTKVTIAGKCCESGDIIQENVMLSNPRVGDVLAVLSTGAYNYSMASNYNRIQKPPIIMVSNGEPKVIVKRQSLEEIVQDDI